MTAITSPLRYPGGKARAIKKILPLIPHGFTEYREPFLGGGSVFVAFKHQNPQLKCKLNDLNQDVYCFWKTLQNDPVSLINAITRIKNGCQDGRALYSKLVNSNASGVFGRALRFYVLNRTTYSGTTDSGGYSAESFKKRFTMSKIEGLWPLAKLLNNVSITNQSYENLLFEEGKNVFIFLDPPYWKARNFPLYGKKGNLNKFFDHQDFAEKIKKCKHTWLITCDDSELIHELFSFAYIYPWKMKYNGMHKKKAIEGEELFITNYEPEDIKLNFQR
ncbi:MAG: DNA adenine methylase [Candidatus Bathyarchaeia archaeon]|jgi:DNA adenine methylase